MNRRANSPERDSMSSEGICTDDAYLDEGSIDVRMSEDTAQAHAIAIVCSEEKHSCVIVEGGESLQGTI